MTSRAILLPPEIVSGITARLFHATETMDAALTTWDLERVLNILAAIAGAHGLDKIGRTRLLKVAAVVPTSRASTSRQVERGVEILETALYGNGLLQPVAWLAIDAFARSRVASHVVFDTLLGVVEGLVLVEPVGQILILHALHFFEAVLGNDASRIDAIQRAIDGVEHLGRLFAPSCHVIVRNALVLAVRRP